MRRAFGSLGLSDMGVTCSIASSVVLHRNTGEEFGIVVSATHATVVISSVVPVRERWWGDAGVGFT
jgi:hypothetical protein